jgi:hypothetical protein
MKLMGNPTDRTANTLVIGSAMVMLATLCYALLVPPRSAKDVTAGRVRSRESVERDIATAKDAVRESETATRARLWNGDAESVVATLLDRWNRDARSLELQVTSFRPQKTRSVAGLTELPGTLQVSGPWPRVGQLLERLERPGARLVVRSVQIASADAASDAVTATVQFQAYLAKPTAPAGADAKAKVVADGGRQWPN